MDSSDNQLSVPRSKSIGFSKQCSYENVRFLIEVLTKGIKPVSTEQNSSTIAKGRYDKHILDSSSD